jgi:hypothetical protein
VSAYPRVVLLLRPSLKIWLDREANPPHWLWRLNLGPLHIVGVPRATNKPPEGDG